MSNPKPYEGHTPLLPCPNPWCEADKRSGDFSPTVISGNFGAHCVRCTSCSMDGPYRRNPIEARRAWNTRLNKGPAADALAEALEGLIRWHIKRGPWDEPLGESEQEPEMNAAVKALAAYREQSNG